METASFQVLLRGVTNSAFVQRNRLPDGFPLHGHKPRLVESSDRFHAHGIAEHMQASTNNDYI
jgi:hypothetical protein